MQSDNFVCKDCNKQYDTKKQLKDHRVYMRRSNQGHEEVQKFRGRSGTSLETSSTLRNKQVTLDFFQEDGSVGAKKGQLDAKEKLKLGKGLDKEPRKHKDPEVAARIQMMAAQFQKESSLSFRQTLPPKGFAPFNTNLFLPTEQQGIRQFATTSGPKFTTKIIEQTSPSSQSSCSNGEGGAVQNLKIIFKPKQFWSETKLMIKSKTFAELFETDFCYDKCMTFLIQSRKLRDHSSEFVLAIAGTVAWMQQNKKQIPLELGLYYHHFFKTLKLPNTIKIKQVVSLFNFCRYIRGDLKWFSFFNNPTTVFEDASKIHHCINILVDLLQCKHLFSQEFFDFIDYVVQHKSLLLPCPGFAIILHNPCVLIDKQFKEALIQYSIIENSNDQKQQVQKLVKVLLSCINGQNVKYSQFIIAIEVALKLNNIDDVKLFIHEQFNSAEELEQILNHQFKYITHLQIQSHIREKEKAEQEKKQKEQAKKIAMDKNFEEEKQNKEKLRLENEEIAKKKQEKEALFRILDEFNAKNKQQFKFAGGNLGPSLQEHAKKIGKILRPEQLVAMNVILESKHQTTLIELATGYGKSLMLAIMAKYLREDTGKKVLVLVPSEVLKVDQTRMYCQEASKAALSLYDPFAPSKIWYAEFKKPLERGNNLNEVILLIDEFHEFMALPAILSPEGISCPLKLIKEAHRVIGVTATFGGEQIKRDLTKLMPNSLVIESPQQISQRNLDMVVIGNLQNSTILLQAADIANNEAATHAVIIFCSDENQLSDMKELLPNAKTFKGTLAEQLCMLTDLRERPTNPNYIVLATPDAVTGLTLFKRAFIIFCFTPKSLIQLRQLAGRGEREDPNVPIRGLILSNQNISNIQDFEKAAEAAEEDFSLVQDYYKLLDYLQACFQILETEPQRKVLKLALEMLNQSKPSIDIQETLFKNLKFKKCIALLKDSYQNVSPLKSNLITQQLDTIITQEKQTYNFLTPNRQEVNAGLLQLNLQSSSGKQRDDVIMSNIDSREEFKTTEDLNNALLGKRKHEQSITKAGTRDVGNFFKPNHPPPVFVENRTIRDNFSVVGHPDLEYEVSAFYDETTNIMQNGQVQLKPGALREISRAKAIEILQEQSQEKQADRSSATLFGELNKKREDKLESKSVTKSGKSSGTNKSFGNALKGTPGSTFSKNGTNFIVLSKFDNSGTIRIVQCQICQKEMRRDKAVLHRNHI